MSAGKGARREAEHAAEAAAMLERKAAYARRRAQSFELGSEGELAVAHAVAPLTVTGWHVLHDRALPHGGNLDHLLVGPGGVLVLDAKNWSGDVSANSVLRVGGRDVSKAVRQLTDGIGEVRTSLVSAGLDLPVAGALVLTHERHQHRASERFGGVLLVGVSRVEEVVTSTSRDIGVTLAEAAVRHLTLAFPGAGADPSKESVPKPVSQKAHPLYQRANVYLYVQPWSRAGRHRLYVNDESGRNLGYKDTVAGTIAVTEPDMDSAVRGVLMHATVRSLDLRADALPKVPMALPGGRLLGVMTRTWVAFHVGYRWRRGSFDRLYGWRADPTDGVAELGYVDLTTGHIHPQAAEPLGKDLGTPERYLERLRDRFRVRT
ncbi:Nuclease-related domain-containing protein [Pedococcus cremeus]|uniref:Nuclease-related domain-containing protein n=1 Tax=Pedococcus cremeus TaxID=587636 RepID=A0A1H9QKC5_9MICO|nr:nuclease-related domain-containing protein [Pedococcus cremeus]SER60878.1 Nuclease-related domain-containing protein [Pedococcus cremeus]